MIQSRHTYTGKLVCDFFSGYKLKRTFRSVNIKGNNNDDNLPVLMIANHFSWWDGFIQYHLNKNVFKRRFHVMMLEEQLSENMILNKGGAFSIRKNSKDVIRSLSYSLELLADKDNLVLIFPQGEIQSIYTDYFKFENGLSYLLKHLKNEIQLVFNINLIDFFSEKKPSLNIYYKEYKLSAGVSELKNIEKGFNDFYNECKALQGKL